MSKLSKLTKGFHKKMICIAFCFFFASITFAQSESVVGNSVLQPTLKRDSVLIEFNTLYKLLNDIHPGLLMHCGKEAFEKCYDSLRQSITTDLTFVEYYMKTCVLISKIKDGHTSVDNRKIKGNIQNKPVFPFGIYEINKQYVINQAGKNEYSNYIGNIILKINGHTLDEVVSKIKPLISLEGYNETGINSKLALFPFYFFLLDTSGVFKIDFMDATGKKESVTLQGVTFNTYLKNTKKVVAPIEQSFLGNIAVLTINTFYIGEYKSNKINYEKYIASFFKKVDKMKLTNLIIDVRGNFGGSAEISNYLFSYLTDQPYYYFEYAGKNYTNACIWKNYCETPRALEDVDTLKTRYIHSLYCKDENNKLDWMFDLQKGKKNFYKGKLIVLSDGGCFSTTGHFLALLRDKKIGQIYGECSQGSNYSNDGGLVFHLPYSGSNVRVPTVQFKMRTPGFVYDSKGICPDVEILKKANDFKTNYDRQLNFALDTFVEKK